ncbi:MAG: glutamine--fructose-6-phosphate transaminase (isomerizing) [Actinomycetota bacterium]|nr:glutamine--fructose-6-phosphate transaminase (isomerizing) [Actinomycetota bacterium]
MCGIIGYVGQRECRDLLLDGLAQLEYRGYDSAGAAVIGASGLKVVKRAGRVAELETALPKRFRGTTGIAHTRWATNGEPTDANAHPHVDASGHIAVVHNGIVENADRLRRELVDAGHVLVSDTDTEVLAHLIGDPAGGPAGEPTDGSTGDPIDDAARPPLEERVRAALARVSGAYGIAVVDDREPGRIVVARNGSPVVLGIGAKEMLVASDVAALVRHTDQVIHLDDGELAIVEPTAYCTITLTGDRPASGERTPTTVTVRAADFDTDGHDTFMHKEIHEQPAAVDRALRGRLDRRFATAHLGGIDLTARDVLGVRRVKILGCGSAFYAGLLGAHLVESLSRIPADAEVASEFRFRNPVIDPDTLYVAVSQSGETYDTLAAVQEIARKGGTVMGVVNTPGSSIARACGTGVHLHAGAEISVTSTKTFTVTAVVFALLALHLGRVRDLGPADGRRLIDALDALPAQVAQVLASEDDAAAVGARLASATSAFYVGRVGAYPIALEGAQKLKEVSYVHAEAYQGAELKHGPLALIDPDVPTVVVLPSGELLEKAMASANEIRARRGPVVAVTDAAATELDDTAFDAVLRVPRTEPELAPVLLSIPLQLVAYHAARALGRDIDKPRNLAKSVTVE